jgi:hypothetical protein
MRLDREPQPQHATPALNPSKVLARPRTPVAVADAVTPGIALPRSAWTGGGSR